MLNNEEYNLLEELSRFPLRKPPRTKRTKYGGGGSRHRRGRVFCEEERPFVECLIAKGYLNRGFILTGRVPLNTISITTYGEEEYLGEKEKRRKESSLLWRAFYLFKNMPEMYFNT
jgi:hypothetical protein